MSDPNHPATPAVSSAHQRPALRASDADREHVAEILRQAAGDGRLDVEELDERLQTAYSARIKADLEPLTADLMAAPDTRPAAASGVAVRPGEGGTSTIVSIMAGNDRAGRWRIAPRCRVVNVMGGADLDLNEVELSDQVTTLTVVSIMGGSDIRVPHGVEVHVSKMAIMGGNDVKLSSETAPPGAPVLHVRLFALMGGNEIRQGPKKSRAERRLERRERRELRDEQRRGELDP